MKTHPMELLREPYPGDPDREIVLLLATLPPGEATPPHTHPGFVVGYVLTGELEFKSGDQPLRRLGAGDKYYEPPKAAHLVSRNPGARIAQVLNFTVLEKGRASAVPLS